MLKYFKFREIFTTPNVVVAFAVVVVFQTVVVASAAAAAVVAVESSAALSGDRESGKRVAFLLLFQVSLVFVFICM